MRESNILYEHAEAIIRKTIEDVLPDRAVRNALEGLELQGRVFVLAVGKAARVMAEAAADVLGARMEKGLVVTKYGHAKGALPGFLVMEAGHPVPDENSVRAGEAAVRFVREAGEGDTVLFLISGGGSALLELPEEGLSLSDIQETTQKLLRCGADITEINLIRKRLSAVKGGKLAGCLRSGKAYSVILSDVVGGSEDMIASGLTYPDRSDPQEVLRLLEKYDLRLPERVERILLRGGKRTELPPQEDPIPPQKNPVRVENHVVGSVRQLCVAAVSHARELGYHAYLLTDSMQGEAGEEGKRIASLADSPDYERPFALIAGGETVVKVTGDGLGGRNQELALSAAGILDGKEDVLLFSLGSDGTDGPTDAAGGIVDGRTAGRLRALGIDMEDVLRRNDAYHALRAADGLLLTGATGTNVNDVTVLLHR
ncbi:MAG TPA: glycerate kinase [Candidatus Eisenbergiella pullistercoris]|uniref:Glycerate kinase n=1 Tax=Candidatus Eisenbergiella pullistercoris TaxID=2838555 RepID=A0A9D2C6U6_9FIRM|nr:glycerate kinase [Candidatus Eisenbergiella pullistercoris]